MGIAAKQTLLLNNCNNNAISNHTPQWLSCSDEAFVKVEITHPELILTAFDEDEFEAAANAADVVNAVIGLDKYSRLAMLYMTP